MKIRFRNIYPRYFSQKVIPRFLKTKLLAESKKSIYKNINDYIYRNYNVSLASIICQVCDNLIVDNNRGFLTIKINPACKEKKSKNKLLDFMQLVDYGNIQYRGTLLFKKNFEFVSAHALSIFILSAASKSNERKSR